MKQSTIKSWKLKLLYMHYQLRNTVKPFKSTHWQATEISVFFLSKFNLLVVFTYSLRFSNSVLLLFNRDILFSTSTFVLFNCDSCFLSSAFALFKHSVRYLSSFYSSMTILSFVFWKQMMLSKKRMKTENTRIKIYKSKSIHERRVWIKQMLNLENDCQG